MTKKRLQIGFIAGLVLLFGTMWLLLSLTSSPVEQSSGTISEPAQESASAEYQATQNHEESMIDSASTDPDDTGSAMSDEADSIEPSVTELHSLLRDVLPEDHLSDDVEALTTLGLADLLEAAEGLEEPAKTEQVTIAMRQLEGLRREAGRRRAEELGLPLRQELPDGRVREVVGITEHGYPLYYATRNMNAAISTGANLLQTVPYELAGTDLVLGVWDGGSGRTTHTEFADGRLSNMNGVASINHATHVAGTMIAAGANANARGMAPEARVDSYDWFDDLTEMLSRGASEPDEAGTIYISNHSYGFIRGWYWNGDNFEWHGGGSGPSAIEGAFGRYNTYARDIDALVFSRPYYAIFWAAGNDRTDNPTTGANVALSPGGSLVPYDPGAHPPGDGLYRGGYDIIGDHALGKNVLTIGAVTEAVTGGERDVTSSTMSSFSSWGPTDDGRIKPDLVAQGTSLTSSGNNDNSHYYVSSGTSMSSPNAAGTAALVKEQFKQLFPGEAMRASAMRGLLIHTADDMGNSGPDYRYGWGLVNGLAAVELLLDHAGTDSSIRFAEGIISAGNRPIIYEGSWDGQSPIRVTLAWTDPAGTATSITDNRSPRLVNNLDVKVIGPNGEEFLPYVMPFVGTWTQASMSQPAITGTNNTDNVEQVYLAEPAEPGIYTIVIDYQGTLQNNEQHFSLFSSGLLPAFSDEDFSLSGDLSFGDFEVGDTQARVLAMQNEASISATITNIYFPSGYTVSWSSDIPSGGARDLVIELSPEEVGDYDGELEIHLAQLSEPITVSMSGTGVRRRFVEIEDPAGDLVVTNSVTTYAVSGNVGDQISEPLVWSNSATGANGALTAESPWSVSALALAEGTNRFTIETTYESDTEQWAEDAASAYVGGWSIGDNEGIGFLPWIIQATGGNAGHFLADSASEVNLSIDDTAWGIWANSGSEVRAERPFHAPLAIGDQFSFQWENNWIETGASVGWTLLNEAGESLVEFYFVGGESHYRINDDVAERVTSVPYHGAGFSFVFERTGTNTYSLMVDSTQVGGQLATRDLMNITRMRIWNNSAGPGVPFNVYSSNWAVERTAGPAQVLSDEVTITRLGVPPGAPDISIVEVDDTSFRAVWTASSNATSYAIDVHTDTSFSNQFGSFVSGFSNLVTTSTNVVVSELEPGTTFFVRAQARSPNGDSPYAVTNVTTTGEARLLQEISFVPIETQVATNELALAASASSGLDVTFTVEEGAATINSGNLLTFNSAGNVSIRASQGGNDDYQPAPDVMQSFQVNKATPLIITPPTTEPVLIGNQLGDVSLIGGSANTSGIFEWVDESVLLPLGTALQTARFVPDASNLYETLHFDLDVTALDVVLEVSPGSDQSVSLPIDAQTNITLTLENLGQLDVSYHWSTIMAFEDDLSGGNIGWDIAGVNSTWHISSNRSWIGEASWYVGFPDSVGYQENMNAALRSPLILVPTNAPQLSFHHWMESDDELAPSGFAWHGGVVEISTDGGETFGQLTPEGGYPALFADYDGAGTPFANGTPIYGGSFDWSEAVFDLSAYAGEFVRIQFRFGSDSFYFNEEGWYIDDIRVTPVADEIPWLEIDPISGTVSAQDMQSALITIDSSGLHAGMSYSAELLLSSEASIAPTNRFRYTLDVEKLHADIHLENTVQLFDSFPKTIGVQTDPPGLATLVTYNGSAAAPTAVGEYAVEVMIDDPVYQGSVTGTLSVVALNGAIEVSDSIVPVDDLSMPFGTLLTTTQRVEQITITNTNSAEPLTIIDVSLASGAPPAEASETASEHPVAPAERFPRAPRLNALLSDAPRDEGTLLVRFRPHLATLADRAVAHAALGTAPRHSYRHIPVDVVELPPGTDQMAMIAMYEARPDVEYAEPNYILSTFAEPNDSNFYRLWGLSNTGQLSGTAGADIDALYAWEYTTGSSNVIVAVIDTGVDYIHADLAPNMWVNPNPTFGDVHGARWTSGTGLPTSGDPMDDHGHGTHVAGTVGALGNNGIGVVGVTWDVQIMALKFITAQNQGTLADAIAAVEYAIDHGAHILNNSYGGGGYSQAFFDVIEASASANQLFVAAAGNDGQDNDETPTYPASYEVANVLSVANSEQNDNRWTTSNWGENTVHLAAPGRSIYSTWPGGGYRNSTGTSMAAPHVAGTAALLMSVHPAATYNQLRTWMLDSVTPLPQWESLVITGGRLNAAAALELSLDGFSISSNISTPLLIPPGESITLDVRFGPLTTNDYVDYVVIQHNDLAADEIQIALSGAGRNPELPAVVLLSAQQRTDGSGQVDVMLNVYAPDSEVVNLEAVFTDGEEEWPAWVATAAATSGNPSVDNAFAEQIRSVIVQQEGSAITNEVSWAWSTTNVPSLLGDPAARIRMRAIDEALVGQWDESEPFVVDNVPPDSSGASVYILTSAQGDYVIGAELFVEWGGFEDELSGVGGYYVTLNNDEIVINDWLTGTNALLTGATLNATNTIFVRAQDQFGNISEAVEGSVLVLDPVGRQTGSRLTNIQKDIAGLDASDQDAEFMALVDTDELGAAGEVVLRWIFAPDRQYTVYRTSDLLLPQEEWTSQVVTNYVVEDGWVVWVDPDPITSRRYYRIEVELE